MNLVFNLWLTANTTSWMLIVYAIKEQWTIGDVPFWMVHMLMIILVVCSSWITLRLSKRFGKESAQYCKEIILADNDFLPVHLGYFFVSLSISDQYTLISMYLLVFCFTYLSRSQHFNPAFLLLGYHYYHVKTSGGTRIFVIRPGKVVRRTEVVKLHDLHRINDSTYIERR